MGDTPLKPLSLLRLIAGLDHAPTLAELTMLAGQPKPTVHRWLATLDEASLVQRTLDGRRYTLGAEAARLALALLANNPASSLRHDVLRRAATELGEACNLTVLKGTEVVYLDRVESTWPLRVTFQPGSRVPLHCSASGKLFLAMMKPAKRAHLMKGLTLERFTPNTLVEADAFAREIADIRRQGFALDREEFMPGLVCVAVPILNANLSTPACVAALALQAPVSRLKIASAVERLPTLRSAATAIEKLIHEG